MPLSEENLSNILLFILFITSLQKEGGDKFWNGLKDGVQSPVALSITGESIKALQ